MKTIVLVVVLCVAAMHTDAQKLPAGGEVLARIAKGTAGIQDYTVNLTVDVDMERIRIPRARATMYFKKPDKVHFDSPNIALIPREGMAFNSAAVLEQYTAETEGMDTVNGLKVLKLQLAAKESTARLRQLFAWVDPETWTVTRIQTIPYEGRLLTLDFVYGVQEENFTLPALLTARFDVFAESGARTLARPPTAPDTPLDQMQSRTPRSGSISIQYSNYRINTGLSDDIFLPKKEKQ